MKPAVTTFTLLAANILVLGFILIFDKKSTAEIREDELWLSKFEIEEAVSVKFTTDEGKAEVVRQEDGSWRFVAPFEDRFAPEKMKEFLALASRLKINVGLEAREIEDEGFDDAHFGFDRNATKVEIFDSDGGTLSAFELGGPAPYEGNVFARRIGEGADDAVHYVWGDLRETTALSFEEMRDPRLIFAKTEEIWRAKFQPPETGQDVVIHIERAPDKRWQSPEMRWQLKAPLEARCDQESVKYIIGLLAKVEVAEFADESEVDMSAFDESKYRIVLRKRTPVKADEKIEIEFGKVPTDENDPYVLARLPGNRSGVFKINKGIINALEMDAFTLRDRTLSDIDYGAVSEVTIKRGGLRKAADQPDEAAPPDIVLRRLQQGWVLIRESTGHQKESANARKVIDLIDRLNSEEVREFESDSVVDMSLYGLDKPKIEMTIKRLYKNPDAPDDPDAPLLAFEDTLMIGTSFKAQEGGNFFAAFKGESRVYKLEESLPLALYRDQDLSYKVLNFWPRFFPLNLRKISLLEKGKDTPLELEFDPEFTRWTGNYGKEDLADRVARESVFMGGYQQFLAAPPRGNRWSQPSAISEARLKDPDMTAIIDLVDPRDGKTPIRMTMSVAATSNVRNFYYVQVTIPGKVIPELLIIDAGTFQTLAGPLKRLVPRY